MEEVEAEVAAAEQSDPLTAFAASIAADPKRADLLIRGASYLPQGPASEQGVATREALAGLVGSLVVLDVRLARSPGGRRAVAGALMEVVRSAVLAGELDQLRERVRSFVAGRRGVEEPALIAA